MSNISPTWNSELFLVHYHQINLPKQQFWSATLWPKNLKRLSGIIQLFTNSLSWHLKFPMFWTQFYFSSLHAMPITRNILPSFIFTWQTPKFFKTIWNKYHFHHKIFFYPKLWSSSSTLLTILFNAYQILPCMIICVFQSFSYFSFRNAPNCTEKMNRQPRLSQKADWKIKF